MIFNRSSGLTTVRLAAPANPPAMKYEDISGLNSIGLRAGSAMVCAGADGAASAPVVDEEGDGGSGGLRDVEGEEEEDARSDVMTARA